MKFLKLTRPVEITAPTMCSSTLGHRTGTIILTPPDSVQGFDPLRLSFGPPERQILDSMDMDSVTLRRRRLSLRFAGLEIGATEHYSVLRFFYPGTNIHFASPHKVPHFTTALQLLSTLDKKGEPAEVEVEPPWYTVKGNCGWPYPEKRGGGIAYTSIRPNSRKRIEINVTARFRKFGEKTSRFNFPNLQLMRNILISPAPGIPSWLEKPARKLWSHGDDTFWPQVSDVEVAMTHIIHHRVQDILGAIALIKSPVPRAFPSLTITSVCSGHRADFNAISMATTTPLA